MENDGNFTLDLGEFVVVPQTESELTFWLRFQEEKWEPEILRVIKLLANSATTFVDIGAWIGPTTLMASALGARVIAFEPDPLALESFRANLQANPLLEPLIDLRSVALSSKDGEASLGTTSLGGSGSSLVLTPTDSDHVRVATRSPTQELKGIAGPVILKIDIEGGEYELLPILLQIKTLNVSDLILSVHSYRHVLQAHGSVTRIGFSEKGILTRFLRQTLSSLRLFGPKLSIIRVTGEFRYRYYSSQGSDIWVKSSKLRLFFKLLRNENPEIYFTNIARVLNGTITK